MGEAGSSRKRADILLVERGLAESRARAQADIKAGHVYAGGEQVTKPNTLLTDDAVLDVRERAVQWVSRAGLKLSHAVEAFGLSFEGQAVLDLGASTGGFTQVALAHGARKVFALDVGHGQMAEKLKGDPRIVLIEGFNARNLTPGDLDEPVDTIVCDVSFISVRHVLPPALTCAKPVLQLVFLVKPQFEAGRAHVGKKGIVTDEGVRRQVCDDLRHFVESDLGLTVKGLCPSPILGGDGNAEFLLYAIREGAAP